MNHWILDNHKPVQVDDLMTWAKWFEKASRVVKQEQIGDQRVSTVFLGIDQSWTLGGPPLLFETMVFGGPLDETQERCSTWEQAEAQHEAVCARVRELS